MAIGSCWLAPSLIIFIIIIIHFPNTTTPQSLQQLVSTICGNSGNYTENSRYQANLEIALSRLPWATGNNHGFNYTSVGQGQDTANAISLCRGDISPEKCGNFISEATMKLRTMCPNQKKAVGWYDFCMLRYSNDSSIFHTVAEGDTLYMRNVNNVTSFGDFNAALRILTNRLQAQAAAGGSLRKFATGRTTGPDNLTIYGLMQCTPDLSEQQCRTCLTDSTSQIPRCCNGKQGGRIIRPSCNLRYEITPFYNEVPAISLPSPPPPDKRRKLFVVVIAIAVTIGSLTIFIFSYSVWRCITKKRGTKQKKDMLPSGEVLSGNTVNQVKMEDLHVFNFEKLALATRNFQLANKLGQGGFGPVFKGTLLDGQEIAVKRLSVSSGQGQEEFMNEVFLISKLQHRNLVRLLGCCIEREEKMLIYEYMPNGSLDAHLFDLVGQECLDWNKRSKIIEGIGRGILYLHRDSRLRIIHRDLKASNILLDQGLNPKISDFGMARILGGDQDQANTRRVVGTYGYMAPEYAMEGRFSEKSDVYSFGVLLLEIVSGRRNSSFYNDKYELSLLQFAWKLWNEGKIVKLIDERLSDLSSRVEVLRYIHVGLLCVQEYAKDRPIVSTVLSMLSSEISNLPSPQQPAFTERKTSSEGEQTGSVNNVTITDIEGR